jgi:hypothetical protein
MSGADEITEFCSDEELGYERSRTPFHPGKGLMLDETYRLAQLPLVAPEHPKVVRTREGTPYQMGRHPAVTSLVLPILGDVLRKSIVGAFVSLGGVMQAPGGPQEDPIGAFKHGDWPAPSAREERQAATGGGRRLSAYGTKPTRMKLRTRSSKRQSSAPVDR